jgi:hypothetical protein
MLHLMGDRDRVMSMICNNRSMVNDEYVENYGMAAEGSRAALYRNVTQRSDAGVSKGDER